MSSAVSLFTVVHGEYAAKFPPGSAASVDTERRLDTPPRRLVSNGPLGGVSGGLDSKWVGIALNADPVEGVVGRCVPSGSGSAVLCGGSGTTPGPRRA